LFLLGKGFLAAQVRTVHGWNPVRLAILAQLNLIFRALWIIRIITSRRFAEIINLPCEIPASFFKVLDMVIRVFTSTAGDIFNAASEVIIEFPGLDDSDSLIDFSSTIVGRMVD